MIGQHLGAIPAGFHRGEPVGITAVCSAHPVVIEAALQLAREQGRAVLIEATCNQVNQEGGYTGQEPHDFRHMVESLAAEVNLDPSLIILGGDHLGPNPWKHLSAETAMDRAVSLVRAYAQAGFAKLHLDTSMGCRGESAAVPNEVAAVRAARLAAAAEEAGSGVDPVYVIGTEVPEPGGRPVMQDCPDVTTPDAMLLTLDAHRAAFAEHGLEEAFARVIALVVQPGVEFSHTAVHRFVPARVQGLVAALRTLPGVVFEVHSTDYQTPEDLRALVANGFAILKVGPALTFTLRDALYALDALADRLAGRPPAGALMAAMDRVMCDDPGHWLSHFAGSETDLFQRRHFSCLDRVRYYWAMPAARDAVAQLMERLDGKQLSAEVVQDHFPGVAVPRHGTAHDILIAAVQDVLRSYDAACAGIG